MNEYTVFSDVLESIPYDEGCGMDVSGTMDIIIQKPSSFYISLMLIRKGKVNVVDNLLDLPCPGDRPSTSIAVMKKVRCKDDIIEGVFQFFVLDCRAGDVVPFSVDPAMVVYVSGRSDRRTQRDKCTIPVQAVLSYIANLKIEETDEDIVVSFITETN